MRSIHATSGPVSSFQSQANTLELNVPVSAAALRAVHARAAELGASIEDAAMSIFAQGILDLRRSWARR